VRACRALREGRDEAALDACARALALAPRCSRPVSCLGDSKSSRWVILRMRSSLVRQLARWVTLTARWVALTSRWVILRMRSSLVRQLARWVTLTARWVALTSRWVSLGVANSSRGRRVQVPAADCAHLHFNKAQAACRLQRHSECMEACHAALLLHPRHVRALALRADVSLVLMEFEAAAQVRRGPGVSYASLVHIDVSYIEPDAHRCVVPKPHASMWGLERRTSAGWRRRSRARRRGGAPRRRMRRHAGR
jgi:hypothetical protein